jgi:UDP-N-acetylglucosamine--N-acetylmuramyl-(pentapeptide) pyrophosphoryl-undecaprenol N-acetylglucosamine transferase
MTATVMITTGGTGGHVFPGLAVAAKLIARGCRVFWLGTREGMEARLVPQHGVEFESVAFRGVRGKGLRTLVLGPFVLLAACVDSLRVIRRRRPNVVLVVGGSLGAAALNDAVPVALAAVPSERRPLVVHQSGEQHIGALRAAYAKVGVEAECVAFIDDMAARYAWADLVICRGGALTVAELAAAGLGAIVIPLPGAIADEQTANARFLVDAGGAIAMSQAELTAPDAPLAGVLAALSRADALTMALAAHRVGKRDAADRVADACIELAAR